MNAVSARTLDFFDRHVVQNIVEKYGFNELQAIKAFIISETYAMLQDPQGKTKLNEIKFTNFQKS